MTEIDRDETSEETIHNLRIICKCKQEEIERLQQRVAELEQRGEPVAWQPIETAPDGNLVVVGWLDDDDHETPERHDFDYKEDGVWVRHEDLYQEFCVVAPPGSRGPREQAPYTHWMVVPPLPEAPNVKLRGDQQRTQNDE